MYDNNNNNGKKKLSVPFIFLAPLPASTYASFEALLHGVSRVRDVRQRVPRHGQELNDDEQNDQSYIVNRKRED